MVFGESVRRHGFSVALWISVLIAIFNSETRARQPATDPAPQPKPEAQAQPPTWRVACDNSGKDFDCRVSQTIFLQKTGQRLFGLELRGGAGTARGAMGMPPGARRKYDPSASSTYHRSPMSGFRDAFQKVEQASRHGEDKLDLFAVRWVERVAHEPLDVF